MLLHQVAGPKRCNSEGAFTTTEQSLSTVFYPKSLLPWGYVELHEQWQYAVAGLHLVDRPCLPLVYCNCARIFSLSYTLSNPNNHIGVPRAYPFGNLVMKPCAFAAVAAATTSS